MRYTLNDVWTPIRANLQQEIVNSYNATTSDTIDLATAQKIESLLYNYTHALRKCYMLFDDEALLTDLQNLVKEVFSHKTYALVVEWKAISDILDVNKGKDVTQDSYYAVADTPHIEQKRFNEFEIKMKQLEGMYTHTQAIKDFYNEIKQLVQTIY